MFDPHHDKESYTTERRRESVRNRACIGKLAVLPPNSLVQARFRIVCFPLWVPTSSLDYDGGGSIAHTNIYDSATSKVVQCDVRKFLKKTRLT